MEELGKIYLIAVSAYAFCIGIGAFFLAVLRIHLSPHFYCVASLILGYIAISVGHGIYLTGGKTIVLGIPGLLLLYLLLRKRPAYKATSFVVKWRSLLGDGWHGLFILTLFFGLYTTLYYFHSDLGPSVQLPHGDSLFYQRVSTYIQYTGQENMLGAASYFREHFSGSNIYHYFDLYFPQWLIKSSDIAPYKIRMLCCSSLLLTMLGFLLLSVSLQHQYASSKVKRGWGAFTLLVPLTALCYGLDLGLIAESGHYKVSFLGYWEGKYIIPMLWMTMVYVLFYKQYRIEALFLLYGLPITSIAYLPAVLFGSALYGGYLLLSQKWANCRKELSLILMLLFLVPAFLWAFYQITGIKQQEEVFSLVKADTSLTEELFLFLRIVIGTLFKYWVDYLPHLLVLLTLILLKRQPFLHFRNERSIFKRLALDRVTLFVGLWLGGLIGWALVANRSPESNQLFRNVAASVTVAALLIEMLYSVDRFTHKQRFFLKMALMLLISLQLYISIKNKPWFYNGPTISKGFEQQVMKLVRERQDLSKPLLIAALGEAAKDYQRGNPEVFYFGNFLMGISDDLLVVNITPPINRHKPLEAEQISPFYQFYRASLEQSGLDSVAYWQEQFIKMNKIDYIICDAEYAQKSLMNNKKPVAKDALSQAYLYEVLQEKLSQTNTH